MVSQGEEQASKASRPLLESGCTREDGGIGVAFLSLHPDLSTRVLHLDTQRGEAPVAASHEKENTHTQGEKKGLEYFFPYCFLKPIITFKK